MPARARYYALNHLSAKVPPPENFRIIRHDLAKSLKSRGPRVRQRAFEKLIAKHGGGRL